MKVFLIPLLKFIYTSLVTIFYTLFFILGHIFYTIWTFKVYDYYPYVESRGLSIYPYSLSETDWGNHKYYIYKSFYHLLWGYKPILVISMSDVYNIEYYEKFDSNHTHIYQCYSVGDGKENERFSQKYCVSSFYDSDGSLINEYKDFDSLEEAKEAMRKRYNQNPIKSKILAV